MSRCSRCGVYVDAFEWPESERLYFRPDLCYSCYLASKAEEESEAEEAANADPNTEYGLSEVRPDPEDDDAPFLGEEDAIEELEEANNESTHESDADESIINLKRLLFG